MAACCPEGIAVNEKAEVIVMVLTQGTENREGTGNHSRDALAIAFNDMVDMKDRIKGNVQGRKFVYIYHDAIDAIGDKPLTESLQCCRKGLRDPRLLI